MNIILYMRYGNVKTRISYNWLLFSKLYRSKYNMYTILAMYHFLQRVNLFPVVKIKLIRIEENN